MQGMDQFLQPATELTVVDSAREYMCIFRRIDWGALQQPYDCPLPYARRTRVGVLHDPVARYPVGREIRVHGACGILAPKFWLRSSLRTVLY